MLLDLARRVPYLTLSLVIHRPTLPMALRATLGDEPHDELHYQGARHAARRAGAGAAARRAGVPRRPLKYR
jgi:hypothetical protein